MMGIAVGIALEELSRILVKKNITSKKNKTCHNKNWLVVWNMNSIFPYVGNNKLN
jgi:hypothetical protein